MLLVEVFSLCLVSSAPRCPAAGVIRRCVERVCARVEALGVWALASGPCIGDPWRALAWGPEALPGPQRCVRVGGAVTGAIL
ncbi:unnamed protein product [Gadus morhua 'NCC']